MLAKWQEKREMLNCFVFLCLFISLLRCFLSEHDDGFDAPESMYNVPGDGEEMLGQVAVENEQVDISSKVQETVSGSIYKMKVCSAYVSCLH